MDGIHDLGGREGFGPIDTGHEDDPPFHAGWEQRVLGMVRSMSRPQDWNIDWFRHCRELIDPADYLARPYYDQWLQSYAAMMVNSGIATVEEIANGHAVSGPAGLGAPAAPESVERAKTEVARFERPLAATPAHAVGDRVRTMRHGVPGHTRLPAYARGAVGEVSAHHGAHVLPDANAHGRQQAEALYTVSFNAADLWPEAAGRRDRIHLDLWESYLEPA